MKANFEEGQKMTRVYRANIIENAYKRSELHGYSMPRLVHAESDGESEDIPLIYNLYSQNIAKRASTKIIPINQLAKLKIKSSFCSMRENHPKRSESSTDSCVKIKRTLTKLQGRNEKSSIDSCVKIKRTLTKLQVRNEKSRQFTLLCCDKQEQLQKYETREISTQKEQVVKPKIKRVSLNKYVNFV